MEKGALRRLLSRRPKWLLGVFLFVLGGTAGFFTNLLLNAPEPKPMLEQHTGQYGFINPLLECENSETFIRRELSQFREIIEDKVEETIEEGKAESIAVYFRDLNNGPFFDVEGGEEFLDVEGGEKFVPGSILKIPIMMAYLKQAEVDPSVLDRKIKFETSLPANQYVSPSENLQSGQSYSVKELIYRMVVYSDNNATWLLDSNDTIGYKRRVYNDLGLPVPGDISGREYTLDIVDSAAFLRVLFNASYLTKDASVLALSILSRTEFIGGLVAGVPPDVPVAHKFAEHGSDGGKQFHDCGIVYYPDYPYLLCVMTKGKNYPALIATIAEVSRLTYEEVDRQMKAAPSKN
ncbi:MAG: serine hydrolase [Thermodesulfovibrionales bacterium]|nr:serine hydrolase [Thermodesulfovibrionales bacterium]